MRLGEVIMVTDYLVLKFTIQMLHFWSNGVELPEAISHATSISQNNFIYLVNGHDGTSYQND